jgi:hypothetical protein
LLHSDKIQDHHHCIILARRARFPRSEPQRCQVQPYSSSLPVPSQCTCLSPSLAHRSRAEIDEESLAFVLRIIPGMSLIPPSSLQVRCVFLEKRCSHLCMPKSVLSHISNLIVTTTSSLFSCVLCGKPSCHQPKNNQHRLETAAGTSSSPNRISSSSTH